MKVIGLTGGIACGKSTVSQELKQLSNVVVIDADAIARDVWNMNDEPYHLLREYFSHHPQYKDLVPEIFNDNSTDTNICGTVNRVVLGSIVFKDERVRAKINELSHMWIFKKHLWKLWEEWKSSSFFDDKVIVLDMPLLFEIKYFKWLTSKTIVIYTTEEHQKNRLMRRNNLTEQEAINRINAQMPLSKKVKMADFIIDNNGDLEHLKKESIEKFMQCKQSASHFGITTFKYLAAATSTAVTSYIIYSHWDDIKQRLSEGPIFSNSRL
jgi:dephospho-CoA kinase